ncbi:hypothetical protein GKQ77_01845 [Streptomyces sp. BG9H]|uniref:Uncharacterized protein n=1 Tax=Streptomyces anatolicus TaxID=2675858 RepID=A0ABS6YFX7_9ACTN|nr:hypothetical protein [Streptomyces anatolicus]MBW5420314.1 hypothetical protein [Streptomyces anatolicus]
MPDRPYTDADLRAEAARQHAELTEDPDFMGIAEQMIGTRIPSTVTDPGAPVTSTAGGRTWDMLARPDFDAAQRTVAQLLADAADTCAWAVNLGADNLVPSTEHAITINASRPIARVLFAFEPGMPEDMGTALVEGIGDAINEAGVEREDDDEPADSDAAVFDLISEIASKLRDATDSGEYHAVGLIYDLANGRTTVAEARSELSGIEFGHV